MASILRSVKDQRSQIEESYFLFDDETHITHDGEKSFNCSTSDEKMDCNKCLIDDKPSAAIGEYVQEEDSGKESKYLKLSNSPIESKKKKYKMGKKMKLFPSFKKSRKRQSWRLSLSRSGDTHSFITSSEDTYNSQEGIRSKDIAVRKISWKKLKDKARSQEIFHEVNYSNNNTDGIIDAQSDKVKEDNKNITTIRKQHHIQGSEVRRDDVRLKQQCNNQFSSVKTQPLQNCFEVSNFRAEEAHFNGKLKTIPLKSTTLQCHNSVEHYVITRTDEEKTTISELSMTSPHTSSILQNLKRRKRDAERDSSLRANPAIEEESSSLNSHNKAGNCQRADNNILAPNIFNDSQTSLNNSFLNRSGKNIVVETEPPPPPPPLSEKNAKTRTSFEYESLDSLQNQENITNKNKISFNIQKVVVNESNINKMKTSSVDDEYLSKLRSTSYLTSYSSDEDDSEEESEEILRMTGRGDDYTDDGISCSSKSGSSVSSCSFYDSDEFSPRKKARLRHAARRLVHHAKDEIEAGVHSVVGLVCNIQERLTDCIAPMIESPVERKRPRTRKRHQKNVGKALYHHHNNKR